MSATALTPSIYITSVHHGVWLLIETPLAISGFIRLRGCAETEGWNPRYPLGVRSFSKRSAFSLSATSPARSLCPEARADFAMLASPVGDCRLPHTTNPPDDSSPARDRRERRPAPPVDRRWRRGRGGAPPANRRFGVPAEAPTGAASACLRATPIAARKRVFPPPDSRSPGKSRLPRQSLCHIGRRHDDVSFGRRLPHLPELGAGGAGLDTTTPAPAGRTQGRLMFPSLSAK